MKLPEETFLNWVNRLLETCADRNIVWHTVYVVPTPFCAMSYIDDGKYFVGPEASETEQLRKEVRISLEFC